MAEIDPHTWREVVTAETGNSPISFFFESGLVDPVIGRYSYAGTDPYRAILSKNGKAVILEGSRTILRREDPFVALGEFLRSMDPAPEGLPFPFTGGAAGYLGYELNSFVENVPRADLDETLMPDMFLACFGRLWCFDHIDNRAYTLTIGDREVITDTPDFGIRAEHAAPDHLESSFTRDQYIHAVEKAKEYIAAGDIFQVNLSQRFKTKLHLDPLDLFFMLQRTNPAPYSAFLRMGSAAIVSSSPEMFLSVRDRHAVTRPIKGTRRRGKSAGEDRCLAEELLKSPKDAAELAMIVDLERNDLGKVCRYGTVGVAESKTLENYASVHHLVATVEGELRDDCDVTDLLLAMFPGGSITGAPKIRSMEIIAELEPTTRGAYTGCIGYIGANGNVDLNIAIRTIVTCGDCAFFNVGGGIVADSDPESEYEETLYKGEKLAEVLRGQRKMIDDRTVEKNERTVSKRFLRG
jgi:para-aminobenzoate synthetase component 1